jgi:hypothetical protein
MQALTRLRCATHRTSSTTRYTGVRLILQLACALHGLAVGSFFHSHARQSMSSYFVRLADFVYEFHAIAGALLAIFDSQHMDGGLAINYAYGFSYVKTFCVLVD